MAVRFTCAGGASYRSLEDWIDGQFPLLVLIGTETIVDSTITFYGSSFITDHKGQLAAEADRETEGVLVAEFDLAACAAERAAWGLFRDRRPETYDALLTLDGVTRS
jgi:N-carbamoylputrescine amidase